MKNVCFVSYGNLYLAPYIKNYLDVISYKCDILVWNRHSIKESSDIHNILSYDYAVEDNLDGKYKKLKGYIGYSRFVKKILARNKYDVVVFLQSIGAICMTPLLITKYRNRYIIDIRDYSIEGNYLLKNIESFLLNHSKLNVISSEGYKCFLPKAKEYCIVHNYSNINIPELEMFKKREVEVPVKLSYIGLIRFQDQNKRIIDLFANDDRFQLRFIGKNALELKEYVDKRNIRNVTLIDQFPPEKTLEYFELTDAILNVYGNNNPLLDYAISNKLYYAASLHIPILVSKNTYMEKKAVGGGFGFTLDFEDKHIKDKLFSYIFNRKKDDFIKSCDVFMEKVKKDNWEFSNKIKIFFHNE